MHANKKLQVRLQMVSHFAIKDASHDGPGRAIATWLPKWQGAADHLINQNAQRPQIALHTIVLHEQLWGHVQRRACALVQLLALAPSKQHAVSTIACSHA